MDYLLGDKPEAFEPFFQVADKLCGCVGGGRRWSAREGIGGKDTGQGTGEE